MRRDHPRSRGVYKISSSARAGLLGSSPLARGLHRPGLADPAPARIIPARAGFTSTTRRARSASRDHPRSRGVYPDLEVFAASVTGSSPLARGLLVSPYRWVLLVGIIPAHAGFTACGGGCGGRSGDHPRSRGVYCSTSRGRTIPSGSSPLARGLPLGRAAGESHAGIIPARAGFTPAAPERRTQRGDHPRSRGVYPCVRR